MTNGGRSGLVVLRSAENGERPEEIDEALGRVLTVETRGLESPGRQIRGHQLLKLSVPDFGQEL